MKTDAHWQKIGAHPHHGIVLFLPALHSQQNFGIGEFLDLIPLIDWCKKVGFDCIQLLPLNDSGNDPSPYNVVSTCALDPIFLSLSALQIAIPGPPPSTRLEIFQKKLSLLRAYFNQNFATLCETTHYQTFLSDNPWLTAYAHFKALKEQHGGKHWIDWPIDSPPPPPSEEHFYIFLQFLCFQQMRRVRDYATQAHVFLMGDFPILPSSDSADVWASPNQFHLDIEAGAPQDAYNPNGQHWGFPLPNWQVMEQTQFAWWKLRLRTLESLYHIYRIDHAVGLFRIWGIPKGKPPLEGAFVPADRALWVPRGKKLLELFIESSPLLPIAEDLGTIPEEVYPILKELGICGMKVVRWQQQGGHYTPFDQYEPLSLTTLTTADMSLLASWWKSTPNESVPFAHFMHIPYHPLLSASQRLTILRAAHRSSSYFHINLLQEYLALFPELCFLDPESERINIPGTILPTNWTYRFRPSVETIVSHQMLADTIRNTIPLLK